MLLAQVPGLRDLRLMVPGQFKPSLHRCQGAKVLACAVDGARVAALDITESNCALNMEPQADIAVIGLAVMGQNLILT